ncbi:MAG: DUF1573 domain-containing protein [Bacteroidetes bacterium]|nr:DUF1573 domain-containing protein [Bacteroidota bacterium]
MHRLLPILLLHLLTTTIVPAQHLRVDATEKSFSEMRPLEQRSVTFVLYNIASDTIFLGQPKPSCGCTATVLDKSTLPPGDSTLLSVEFRAAPGMNGTINKSVTLYGRFAGVDEKLAVLRVHAEIAADLKFEPGILRFASFIGDVVVVRVTLMSNTDTAVTLSNITADMTAYVDTSAGNIYHVEKVQTRPFTKFSIALDRDVIEAGDSARLTLTLYPQEKGQLNGTIRIPLSDTELRIPVVGAVLRQRE